MSIKELLLLEEEYKNSDWIYETGIPYKVLMFTNVYSTNDKYKVQVVYQGLNGKVWSKSLINFQQKMSKLC